MADFFQSLMTPMHGEAPPPPTDAPLPCVKTPCGEIWVMYRGRAVHVNWLRWKLAVEEDRLTRALAWAWWRAYQDAADQAPATDLRLSLDSLTRGQHYARVAFKNGRVWYYRRPRVHAGDDTKVER